MYQFASGAFISGLFTAHEAITAGTPILVNSDGELAIATNDLAIHGVATTDVAIGLPIGFQGTGFLRTSMIDGTIGAGAIAIGDELEVASGKFAKKEHGVAVAIALTAVTTNMSTKTNDDAFDAGLTLPLIKLL